MHKGAFKGKNLATNPTILILGESHYQSSGYDPEFTTDGVVLDYFQNPNCQRYKFFDKIVTCFGFAPEDREKFWNQVWFGNYVTSSDCGVGTTRARELVAKNRGQYNRELFDFVNTHGIDTIFCFSRMVYNNMPGRASFESEGVRIATEKLHGKADYISQFIYLPGERPYGDVALKKPLTVYGFRHPSARGGFAPSHYFPFIREHCQL